MLKGRLNLFKKIKKGFKIKKNLGQNFITDSKICEKIVRFADVENKLVVEIGPGQGALTAHLLKKAAKVVAIEKDIELIPILKQRFLKAKNFELICADFLKIDLNQLILKNKSREKEVVVCGNLPYYISSLAVVKILELKEKIKMAVLMFQKEFALRLVAKPGSKNCGAISVLTNYFSKPEILFYVLKGSFFPIPKVDSAVLKLTIKHKKDYFLKNQDLFFKIVRASFLKRRKILINPLSEFLKISKKELEKILAEVKINPKKRAEQLSLKEFVELANKLEETLKKD